MVLVSKDNAGAWSRSSFTLNFISFQARPNNDDEQEEEEEEEGEEEGEDEEEEKELFR